MAVPPGIQTHTQLLHSILENIAAESKDKDVAEKIKRSLQLVNKLQPTNTDSTSSGILAKFNLSGQVALVTGGGQGIGRGFAHALGEAGCKVAIADIVLETAQSVVAELTAKGIEAIAIHTDVSKKDQVDEMVKKILDTWGTLHIACNNAGVLPPSTNGEDVLESDWEHTLAVNLSGVFFCCQAEAKHMLPNGYGRIINIASICSHVSIHPLKVAPYNASKAGCRHLTKTLGAEWGKYGVRVNSISPVYINTPLLAGNDLIDTLKPGWVADIPVGRIGEIDDLLGALLYLASPACEFMTGTDLLLDGGHCCW